MAKKLAGGETHFYDGRAGGLSMVCICIVDIYIVSSNEFISSIANLANLEYFEEYIRIYWSI